MINSNPISLRIKDNNLLIDTGVDSIGEVVVSIDPKTAFENEFSKFLQAEDYKFSPVLKQILKSMFIAGMFHSNTVILAVTTNSSEDTASKEAANEAFEALIFNTLKARAEMKSELLAFIQQHNSKN